jgi:transposase
MSLHPLAIYRVPEDTARVAHAAFPKGHPYLALRDELGAIFEDRAFAKLFSARGRSAIAPAQLARVTILQFAEGLSDMQAADAVRARIDWKYVLSLELDDPGFDASVLCEFRARLLAGEQETLLLDTLLARCRERGLLKARGQQRTDSTQVLAAVRALNRLEVVGETMRHALNTLAVVAPAWLGVRAQPEWADRYARRIEDDRLPAKQAAREALALAIGADGYALLAAVYDADAPAWLREVPAVETLRRVWVQQYQRAEGAVRWRGSGDIPPGAVFISSPHDADAHYARKRTTQWVGYKLHLTETCDRELPRLITNVETTAGPTADGEATPAIHAALKGRDLLPRVHLVDTGFLDAALLVASRDEYGVELLGPTRGDYRWQARAGEGFDVQQFQIDWEHERATCPAGRTSLSWTPAVDKRTNAVIKVKFSAKDCRHCAFLAQCCHSQKKYPRRTITIRPQAQYEALQAARRRAETPEFAAAYAARAGIEGTLSRGVRTCRLRRTRYIGQARTHLGHVFTAAALNFLRLGEWFADLPRARTRRSPFAKLMAEPLAA